LRRIQIEINIESVKQYFPFPDPRENQLQVAHEIIQAFENGHDFVLLNAPTGVGKSPIAMTVARYYAARNNQLSSIVTSEKILQDQYTDDFSRFPEIISVKGVGAYTCPEDGSSASEALCKVLGIKQCENKYCDYKIMLRLRRIKPLWITNYSISLTNILFKKREHKLFICDEMHKLEAILLNNVTASFSLEFLTFIKNRLDKMNKEYNTEFSTYKLYEYFSAAKDANDPEQIEFYTKLFSDVYDDYRLICEDIETFIDERFKHLKEKNKSEFGQEELAELKKMKYCFRTIDAIDNILCRFELMLNHVGNKKAKWMLEILEAEILFKPIYASFLFSHILGKSSDKFLFMSATTYCKQMFCDEFNIPFEKVHEISLDSPFPVDNRKIYFAQYTSMAYDDLQNSLRKMVTCIDEILDTATACRVVIHSGNYSIARYIELNSRHRKRIIAPKSGERELLIETEFKKRADGVLVSPSLIEGVSLNDDMCRVQLVVKVPFTSLSDKRIKIRSKADPLWYKQEAIFKLIQACGRGVRHKDDYCITFVLDSAFAGLYYSNSFLFSEWFLKAVERIKSDEIIDTLRNFLGRHNLT